MDARLRLRLPPVAHLSPLSTSTSSAPILLPRQSKRSAAARCHSQADVSNRFQVAATIERTRDAFGSIDILVNASSIFHAEPLLTIDEWNWRRQIEVNITGAFFCMQLVGRVMADEGGGSIVNLAAVEACESSLPAGIGYVAGGAGLIGMARQAARELAPHGIRVNCIASNTQDESSADIADAALFLCSSRAKSVTGQVIDVDDGRSWRSKLCDSVQ